MSFKISCEKCNNSGRIFEKEDAIDAFFRTVRIEGDFTLDYGESEGYDHIEIACNKCDNKVVD